MNETLFQAASLIIPLVIAIVFHEVAHGAVARMLGDPTAAEARRLSLNPLRHVDPVGTVLLPGMLALVKAPVFGWAKPVPVDFTRLRNPRLGMAVVAAAGPLTNFGLGVIGAILLGLLARFGGEGVMQNGVGRFVAANLMNFLAINIFLALFNLLPIPPFDGSHIVEAALPRPLARRYAALRGAGFAIVLVLLVVLPWLIPSFDPVPALVGPPFEWAYGHYLALASQVAGG